MSDVTLLSGISGLSFDSPFLSPLFFSAKSSCSFCLVIFLLMVHSSGFFSRKLKYFSLRVRLFCMAFFFFFFFFFNFFYIYLFCVLIIVSYILQN